MHAQKTNSVYQAYVEQYASMAVDQMRRHKIPASITLAQGLLESAAGRSTLAVRANNHFGIKTGGGWTGPYVLRDDDKPNERFRKYASVAESYEDHSLFLQKPRYASLFIYDTKDYTSWAYGLKACGYATSPTYAETLIKIIETYRLYEYDGGKAQVSISASTTNDREIERYMSYGDAGFYQRHPIAENNHNYYIRIIQGDDLYTIASETGVKVKKLRQYNELPDGMNPQVGSVLYLRKKRNKADRAFKNHPHTVTAGQSMYDICQMYGMRLKTLYKLNKLSADYMPQIGDQLRIY
ncbi:MAG: glucosaminidase domain-containing protein [Bacteroidaceae bacterium]|nr:glucosaminidase domain-containing protein [Bacteroidaceae bacterium]